MPRIKIKDLPKGHKISKEEMKKVLGGLSLLTSSDYKSPDQIYKQQIVSGLPYSIRLVCMDPQPSP